MILHMVVSLHHWEKKIGKEIHVFKNEKYGKEVFKCSDFRIEVCTFLVFYQAFF